MRRSRTAGESHPARALPGQHAGGVDVVEEAVATEVTEDASLDDGLHLCDAIGRQVIGLVKRDLAVVDLVEDAVEDDKVVVRVVSVTRTLFTPGPRDG